MTTASITVPRTASVAVVGPVTRFWTEMLAAWQRMNEIEYRMRAGR
ncbi:hypothetical protein [Arenivirga flava]|uniref:Uncharacterized protein n=1 Tax=Arenivirga flava TaxID=1930060 RepID=A0AA37UNP5_9MICO|nr:hypothetical protein [Arenivirga flava]GMA28311.1 hypothetical protein GCM10025874_15640 [Arenivirga flava]